MSIEVSDLSTSKDPLALLFYLLLNEVMPVRVLQKLVVRSYDECEQSVANSWAYEYAAWLSEKYKEGVKPKNMPSMVVADQCPHCGDSLVDCDVISGTGYQCSVCGGEV